MRVLLPCVALALVSFASITAHHGTAAATQVRAGDDEINAAEEVAAPPLSDSDFAQEIPTELVVDLKDDASEADIADVARTYGLTLHANSPWSNALDKIEIASVDPAQREEIIARLAKDSRVENAERQVLLHASFVPNDPMYDTKQWHLKRAGGETAWDYACGRGVTVAVIDTGVACYDKGGFMKGTDLGGTPCGNGYNFVNDTTDAFDDHGHGTHVAGTIAQTTDNGKGVAGLAHCATLMPVKVLSKQGYGTVADVAEGIRFAADNGAQVINMSLGGPIKSKILEEAVNHALGKGVIIVAAAGNSGRSVGWPAAYPGVIAVSATDQNDKLAWFSSRGPEVAIGAPGVNVTQQTVCEGGQNKCEIFGTFSGTSMASPHVAGAAALLVGQGITDREAVRAALRATAVPKDNAEHFGAGILDAGKASSRTHWWHVALRLMYLTALGIVIAKRMKSQGGGIAKSKGALVAALFTSVGLLPFAPLFKLAGIGPSARIIPDLLMRPFGEWDLLLNVSIHRFLPLASAIPAIILAGLFFGTKRLRYAVGGFALGSAALLAQLAVSGDVAFFMGPWLMRIFAVVNALVCLWIARISLDTKKA